MFKGKTTTSLQYILVYMSLFGLVTSIGLMGPQWTPFFLFGLALLLIVILPILLLAGRFNRFSFDDQGGAIVRPGGRRWAYQNIKGFLVLERGNTIDIYLKLGPWHTTSLVLMLDAIEVPRLREELQRRFPTVTVRVKRWPRWATVLLILVCLVLAFGAAHGFLYHRYPQLHAVPRTIEAATVVEGKVGTRRLRKQVGDFRFELPERFAFIGEREGALSFEDTERQLRLEVITGVVRGEMNRHAFWFRYGMGVRDYADLATFVIQSRYGVIPLFLRALTLMRLDDVALYQTRPPQLRGFIIQGRRGNEQVTHVFLAGTLPRQELHVFITGPVRVSDEMIGLIVSGVRLDPAPKRATRESATDEHAFLLRRQATGEVDGGTMPRSSERRFAMPPGRRTAARCL
jgi:hypothetical protein